MVDADRDNAIDQLIKASPPPFVPAVQTAGRIAVLGGTLFALRMMLSPEIAVKTIVARVRRLTHAPAAELTAYFCRRT